jgi:hypothetical protein
MNGVGSYDHLNKDTPIKVNIDIDVVARAAVESNYGIHRLLSALVRQATVVGKRGELIESIERMLNNGAYL